MLTACLPSAWPNADPSSGSTQEDGLQCGNLSDRRSVRCYQALERLMMRASRTHTSMRLFAAFRISSVRSWMSNRQDNVGPLPGSGEHDIWWVRQNQVVNVRTAEPTLLLSGYDHIRPGAVLKVTRVAPSLKRRQDDDADSAEFDILLRLRHRLPHPVHRISITGGATDRFR
jgi:hypothetical protein